MVRSCLVGRSDELQQIDTALSRPSRGVVLVRGGVGGGKSALLETVLGRVREAGRATELIAATLGDPHVRFSAVYGILADVLADAARPDTTAGKRADSGSLLRDLIGGLQLRHPDGLVIGVDDIDLLDDGSALLLGQMGASPRVTIVATLRSNEGVPSFFHALRENRASTEVSLGRLADDDVDGLAAASLGGTVDAALTLELCRCSGGNPLLARCALDHGRRTGAIVRAPRAWTVRGTLETPLRLEEVIRGEALAEAEVAAGELIAWAEPIELAIAEQLAPPEALERLERRRLARVETDGRRHVVRIVEPAVRAAFRATIPRVRRRQLARSLRAELPTLGARRSTDLPRLASWMAEAGDYSQPDVYIAAADRSLTAADAAAALRFASAAALHSDRPEPRVQMGHALGLLGRYEEAETHLAAAAAMPLAPEQQVDVAMTRARNAYWGAGDADRAERVLATAAESVPPGRHRDHLVSLRAGILLFGERYDEALQLCQPMLQHEDTDREAYVLALPTAQVVWLLHGEIDRVRRTAIEWLPTAVALNDTAFMSHLRIQSMLVHAQLWKGAATEALHKTQAWLAEALAEGQTAVAGFWNHHVAWIAFLYAGQVKESALVTRALQATEDNDLFFHRSVTHALLAMALALQGELDPARAAMQMADETYDARSRTFRTTIDYCQAWVTRLHGDEAAAIQIADRTVHRCQNLGDRVREATVLDTVARWGHPHRAAMRLQQLSSPTDSPVIRMMADAAEAAVNEEPRRVLSAAAQLERAGWLLHAADHTAVAARLFSARSDLQPCLEAMASAHARYRRTGSTRTPALVAMTEHDPRLTLSPREREVCAMAAMGLTNSQIASRLHVHRRTIDNHLARAARKLGFRGPTRREALTDALGKLAGQAVQRPRDLRL